MGSAEKLTTPPPIILVPMRPGENLGTTSSSSSVLDELLIESCSELRFSCTDECRTSSGDKFLDPRMEAAAADVAVNIDETAIIERIERFIIMNESD